MQVSASHLQLQLQLGLDSLLVYISIQHVLSVLTTEHRVEFKYNIRAERTENPD